MEQKCPSRDFNPGAEGGWAMGMGLGNIGGILASPVFKVILEARVRAWVEEAYDSPSSATVAQHVVYICIHMKKYLNRWKQIQALAGAMPMGSIFGSTMSGYAADRYGR
eukprot:1395236-Amorphochlora_amoeboformis.AAC.1